MKATFVVCCTRLQNARLLCPCKIYLVKVGVMGLWQAFGALKIVCGRPEPIDLCWTRACIYEQQQVLMEELKFKCIHQTLFHSFLTLNAMPYSQEKLLEKEDISRILTTARAGTFEFFDSFSLPSFPPALKCSAGCQPHFTPNISSMRVKNLGKDGQEVSIISGPSEIWAMHYNEII